jgi:SSS family solute:Na+ symporter
MSKLDYLMIIFWVVGTSLVGLFYRKFIKTTRDYLLAGKRLKWWQIGISQTADAVDATDFVAASGNGYRMGLVNIGFSWYGMGLGYFLLSRYITPLLYRTGVYTNAEFLELRYNTAMRVLSTILQTLYRMVAMALVVYSLATIFNVILGVPMWPAIAGSMGLTLIYVFTSGQLGVVMAAIPQVILMLVAGFIVFGYAWHGVGGWSSMVARIPDPEKYLHFTGMTAPGVPGYIYFIGMTLSLLAYPIVNQTVAQRLVAARSELDARDGAIFGLPGWFVVTALSTIVGIMAVLLIPDLTGTEADRIYPMMMVKYLPSGILGLVVASLMLASMSTGAGIGTAIAGLLTVDIYARFLKKEASDRHYLWMTRLFASATIILGTLFAYFIPRMGGMIPFYLAMTGSFFLPLTVPYIGGAFFSFLSRWSGFASTLSGAGVGLVLFVFEKQIPVWMGHTLWRPIWSFLAAWAGLFICSMIENRVHGPRPEDAFGRSLNVHDLGYARIGEEDRKRLEEMARMRQETAEFTEVPEPGIPAGTPWYLSPTFFEAVAIAILVFFLVLWW